MIRFTGLASSRGHGRGTGGNSWDTGTTADAAPPPTEPEPAATDEVMSPGAAVARYTILGELGRGGMGVVYKAYDPSLDRVVALKVMRGRSSKNRRDRMLREAQALAKLAHPNVIAVHEVGIVDEAVFVAMEYVPGATLAERKPAESRGWLAETIRLYCQAGRGLAAAHAAELVHRDFKPANVIVADDGRVRVVDFGLARGLRGSDSRSDTSSDSESLESSVEESTSVRGSRLVDASVTEMGALVGTPRYMAPEQLQAATLTAATDQFAFCVAAWESLTGEHPFGDDDSKTRRLRVIAGDLAIDRGAARLPRHVRQALERGLEVDPARRWPDMGALLAELERDPRARLRRTVAIASALLLLLMVVLIQRGGSTPCTGSRARLSGVWDAAVAQRVSAAFLATGWVGASEALQHVASALDDYSDEWVAGYVDACRATRVVGAQSEELLDRRMQCLDRRLGEMRAATSLLARADREVATASNHIVGALGDVQACADAEALASGVALPVDRRIRAEIDWLYEQVDEASVLLAALRVGEARALLEALTERAHATRYPPIEVEVALALSAARRSDGDGVGAHAAAEVAIAAAGEADDDSLFARALLQEAQVRLEGLTDAERVLSSRVLLASALAKAGTPQRLELLLDNLLAQALDELGRFDDAVAQQEQALELARSAFGPQSQLAADALRRLAAKERTAGRFAQARAHAAEAIARYEQLLGPNHPELYRVLLDAASTESSAGDLELSHRYITRALELLEAALPGHHRLADGYRRLGSNLARQGDWEDAEAALLRAAALEKTATPPDTMVLADVEAWLGDVVKEARGLVAARPHYAQVRDYYHQSGRTDDPFLGESLAIWGEAECAAGEVAAAQELFEEARGILAPRQDTWQYKLMISEANCLTTVGRAAAAVGLARQAATALDRTDSIADRADAHYALARALWSAGERRDSTVHAQQALTVLEGSGRKRSDEIAAWLAEHRSPR